MKLVASGAYYLRNYLALAPLDVVDVASVSHVTATQVLDGDELRRQVEVVVAVVDAFERATGEPP